LSLNLFVLLVLAVCALSLLAFKAVSTLVNLPRRAGEWRALRRERAAAHALREAMTEYFAARYSRARKAADRALACAEGTPQLERDGEFLLLAHLVGAGSLHRLQDRTQRDESLRQAMKVARDIKGAPRSTDEAPRLLAAEWALDDRDALRALEALAALPAGVARRTHALRLKLKAARMARRPLEALHTARLLANHQAFSPDVAQSLTRSLAREVLDEAHAIDQLHRLWSQLDAADRRDPQVVAMVAQRAVRLDAPADARQWLRPFWDKLSTLPADDRCAVALALIEARSGIGSDWLPRLEQALHSSGHESEVAAAVGMAYADRGLWGKARVLLQQSAGAVELPNRTRRAVWRQLAALAREDNDEPTALRCEQAAAALD
ncbi:MAG: heme biosynthesis HemY N-terminal domain-containing protein, partial [Rubrivivax sp.]